MATDSDSPRWLQRIPTNTAARRPDHGAAAHQAAIRTGSPSTSTVAFAFALPAQLVADERIEVGDVLDEARVASLRAADEASRATEAALVFLGYRPRSEREVRDRLRRGGYGPDAIDHAIARLHEWRYLDDADFARRWVENRTDASTAWQAPAATRAAPQGYRP